MKKLFTFPIMGLLFGFAAQAYAEDVKVLSFTTEKEAEGKELMFKISAVDGGTVFVDWGTGNKEEYTVADYDADGWVFTELKGTLGSSAVEVYTPEGTKINYVDLDWTMEDDPVAKITAVELINLPDVKELNMSKNHIKSVDLSSCASLATFNATDNCITSLTIGEANAPLSAVNVSNNFNVTSGEMNEGAGSNALIATNWTLLPALRTLNISGNKATEGDNLNLEGLSSLSTLYANGCALSSINIKGATALKTFNAQWNNFETIDLSDMVALKGIATLNNNKLTEIKLPETTDKFTRINISSNYFTFATLPSLDVATNLMYTPQAEVVAPVNGAVVDLSSLAKVGDTATVFSWKRGDEEISEGYTEADGVFTFTATGDYFCSMTNEVFPALTLTTKMITISDVSGVAEIEDNAAPVEFYNLKGVKVSGTEPGIYVRRQGNKVSKVIVK